ncbi:MAG: XkdX family protein [Clostridium sp.]
MSFWTLAYDQRWVTEEALKGAVITPTNQCGEITPEE